MIGNRRQFAGSLLGMCVLGIGALAVSAACTMEHAYAAPVEAAADKSAVVKPAKAKAIWKKKGNRFYCIRNGKKLTGMRAIGGHTYLFSKKGVQRTGWVKTRTGYRYYQQRNGAKGFLVKNRVVNGVKLGKDGIAIGGKAAGQELRLMARAATIAESQTRAGWSQRKKLRAVWRWMQKNCIFRSARTWHNRDGFHRLYANDILFKHGGDCDSWAAGFTYLANAVGAKRCNIISSSGHGWAEVNGKVYDLEESGHTTFRYFAYPYVGGHRRGAPDYRHNRTYVVKIAPRTKRWSHAKERKATHRQGLVVKNGRIRYYDGKGRLVRNAWKTVSGHRYWFKSNGIAAKGPTKIRGKRYVFDGKCRLSRGANTHIVTVGEKRYRVSKAGRALSGWYASNRRYSYASGEVATGLRLIGKTIWSFSSDGLVDADRSARIKRACKIDADPTDLIAVLGKAHSVSTGVSCNRHIAADGTEQTGNDITYRYPHFNVYCFEVTQKGAPDEGKTFLKDVYR